MSKTISIVGTGYVGLTTAAILSNIGYKVYTIDVDQKKIDTIKSGKSFFYEDGLDDFVKKGIDSGNLIPTLSYEESIPTSDIVFSCVGTPDREDGSPNLDYIFSAAQSVAQYAKQNIIFVQKSTVPVGTGRKVIEFIKNKNHDLQFSYISNPEFLAEGSAVFDTLNIDRLVIGGDNTEALEEVQKVFETVDTFVKSLDTTKFAGYAAFYKSGKEVINSTPFIERVIRTNLESAELIKVTANAFLALKISFANSIAKLCDETNADVNEVMHGVGADHRIGKAFLYAGLGWGGGCFPKDVSGLVNVAKNYDIEMDIMNAAVDANDSMIDYMIHKMESLLGNLEGKKIAVLGLSFKPGTSDVRKSQSIKLANKLVYKKAHLSAFDPQAMEEAQKTLDVSVSLKENINDTIKDADAVIIATEWKEFLNYNWSDAKSLMSGKLIVDARNRLNKKELKNLGFDYIGIGR